MDTQGMRRRVLLAGVSLAVTLAAFVATTWALGRWQEPARRRAPPPAFGRTDAQPAAAVAPPARDPGSRHAAEAAWRREAVAAAAEAAEEAARARVVDAAKAADEPLERGLHRYLDALRSALEESGDEALLAYRSVWTEHFLRIDTVQEELAALPPGARRNALASVRREMGFTPDEIEVLAERDAVRDARWEVGLGYMEERRRLTKTFEGDALEEELRHLRERTFAHEARTIALEEASGFFRFERPRIYGRN
jgi:hypothetical protein